MDAHAGTAGHFAVMERTDAIEDGQRLALEWRETNPSRSPEVPRPGGYRRERIEKARPCGMQARTTYDVGTTELTGIVDPSIIETTQPNER